MKPIKFDEQNKILGKPDSMTDEECISLPVFSDGTQCISKWELDASDIKHIKEKGYIWIRVFSGETQPPISIEATETVFKKG